MLIHNFPNFCLNYISLAQQQPDLPKRKLLEDAPPESSDDAELWRALLMKDKQKMSQTLVSTDVIANNLSDKPIDFVPEETVVRRRGDESERDEKSGGSTPRSPGTPTQDQEVIGNPPLAIGNPPLAESPSKPKLSYRQRAAAAAAQEEDEDKISAGDMSSGGSSSDSESSSSEEGEISDDDDEDAGKEDKKDEKSGSDVDEKTSKSPKEVKAEDDNSDGSKSPIKDSEYVQENRELRTENENVDDQDQDVSKLYAL